MKTEIKVPRMGESISEAIVGTILKASGSIVKADEEVLELETDKVNQAVFAPQKGKITLTVKEGDKVPVDSVIGYIEEAADGQEEKTEPAKDVETSSAKTKQEPEKKAQAEKITPQKNTQENNKPKKSSPSEVPAIEKPTINEPAIRYLEEDFIQDLKGKESADQPKAKPKETKEIKVSGSSDRESRRKMPSIRQVIAQRLVAAQHETAMLTTFNEVDMSVVMELRTKYQEEFVKKYGVKLGLMSFFVKASVSALNEFPLVNSYLDGSEIVQRNYYDLGLAVSTDKGVMVPVIKNCDQLSMAEIEKKLEEFAKKAREGNISISDLQGGGFTITNGGVFGSLLSTPILNPPQCAILGMHTIQKRAVVINDQIVIRPMMYLALTYDHRLIDGREAVKFLIHIKNIIENPPRILLQI